MQTANLLSSSERFQNPHRVGSWRWHWHERMIREVASHIANMPPMDNSLIQRAKIFGTLERLEHRLARRTSRPRQIV